MPTEVKLSSALEHMGLLSIEDESGPADQRKNELTATTKPMLLKKPRGVPRVDDSMSCKLQ